MTSMPGTRLAPTRRAVLLASLPLGLACCGLRLDTPPPPPPVPTRKRVNDEQVLLDAVHLLSGIAAVAPGAGTQTPAARAAALVATQRTTLVGRLTNAGVPVTEITTAGTAASTRTSLPEALWTVPAPAFAALAAATTATRDLLWSAAAARRTQALVLGRRPGAVRTSATLTAAWQPVLAPLDAAFDVVAAQSYDTQRDRAMSTRNSLRALATEVGAASGQAYALPFPVTSSATARRLAQHALATAVAASVPLARALAPTDLDAAATVAARLALLGADWGVALVAFPGMVAR